MAIVPILKPIFECLSFSVHFPASRVRAPVFSKKTTTFRKKRAKKKHPSSDRCVFLMMFFVMIAGDERANGASNLLLVARIRGAGEHFESRLEFVAIDGFGFLDEDFLAHGLFDAALIDEHFFVEFLTGA